MNLCEFFSRSLLAGSNSWFIAEGHEFNTDEDEEDDDDEDSVDEDEEDEEEEEELDDVDNEPE